MGTKSISWSTNIYDVLYKAYWVQVIRQTVEILTFFISLKVAYTGLIKRKGLNQEVQRQHFQSQIYFCIVATLFTLEWLVDAIIDI